MRKFLSHIFIFLVIFGGIGVLHVTKNALASTANPNEACQDDASNKPCVPTVTTLGTCRYDEWDRDNDKFVKKIARNTKTQCDDLRTVSGTVRPLGWTHTTIEEYRNAERQLAELPVLTRFETGVDEKTPF